MVIERNRARALLITDVTGPGGVGTHIGQLALVGERRGWDVSVLMDGGAGSNAMAFSLRQSGVSVTRANLYRGYHTEERIREAVLAAFDHYHPDVVHVHCGSPRSAVLPRELAVAASIPLIVTEHFVAVDLQIAENILQKIRQLYDDAFAVIAVCDENRTLLREKFGLSTNRLVVIRNGVNLPTETGRLSSAVRDFKAITVARLSPEKGIDVLFQAIDGLSDDVAKRVQFTIVGDGDQEKLLKQMVQNLGISDRINFLGWSFDVPSLLRAHDLFILPSIAEGQPIALLEALAAGLPCIASAVSGIPEVLGGGKYGTLVRPKDPASLSGAIAAFAKDPTTLRKKTAAARAHLQMNHDNERNMAKVIDLWHAATVLHKTR